VPGGGVALLRCQKALENLKLEGEEKVAIDILSRAIESPIRKIAEMPVKMVPSLRMKLKKNQALMDTMLKLINMRRVW